MKYLGVVWVVLVAGCSSVSKGSEAETCQPDATRCEGESFQRCSLDGVFETAQTCAGRCDAIRGCISAAACVPALGGGEVAVCADVAPPVSFEPEVQWSWAGEGEDKHSIVTPLVANLTDDNDDGFVDLCDTPDVLVVAGESPIPWENPGHIYVLDGATGTLLLHFSRAVDMTVTPAIGDIDGDYLPEIVAATDDFRLIVFEHDGTVKWIAEELWLTAPYKENSYGGAIALADADNDGDVEILAGNLLYDHTGNRLWEAPVDEGPWPATTMADLDGDGDLEIVLGNAAYHHDGTEYYHQSELLPGYPQVANLDDDPQPEVLLTNKNGITVLEHDGTIKFSDVRPTMAPPGPTTWVRPAAVHDFDGDGKPEFALSSASAYAVYRRDGEIMWLAGVDDSSGIASSTAFDFLGDGTAEAMYADEHRLFVYDEAGNVLFDMPRQSGTLTEYPVVADIDNDGSAEIVVTSNNRDPDAVSPTVQVIRDKEDRWIQARRIWNQHAYHVTNVNEDATIPVHQAPSWKGLNTFRTNAQIEGGMVCDPGPVIE